MKQLLKAILGLVAIATCSACNTTPTNANLPNVRLVGVASNVTPQGFTVVGTKVISSKTNVGAMSIANGSVVDVRGKHKSDGSVEANEIIEDTEIKGSISSIDITTSIIVVLGQTIQADLNTVYEGSDSSSLSLATLKIGDYIEVSGLRQADGSLLASRIELEKGEKPSGMEVKGVVTNLDTTAKTFMLGMQVVDYSGLTNVTLTNGQRVAVKGTLNSSSVLIANRIVSKNENDPEKPRSGDIELEGTAGNVDTTAKTLVVHGFQVDYSNAILEGTPVNGSRVEVEGTIQADGSVKASKIEFKGKRSEVNDADGKVEGKISAIDATTKTITVAGIIYSTDANTKVERGEIHIAFTDLQINDNVEVRFVTTSKLARKIEIELPESK